MEILKISPPGKGINDLSLPSYLLKLIIGSWDYDSLVKNKIKKYYETQSPINLMLKDVFQIEKKDWKEKKQKKREKNIISVNNIIRGGEQ